MKRTGTSLIEMIATMAVGSILTGLTAMAIALVLRGTSGARERIDGMRTLDRLESQFRTDAHAASEASEQTGGLMLTLADRQIEYRATQDRLEREEQQAGATIARESFRLPRGAEARFELFSDEAGRWAQLTVAPPGELAMPAAADAPTLRAVAVLRSDRKAKP
ncbi:MAG: hypothetical protein K1X71_10140 [Pirellulales bacterium]|nr:hypothetical protein [Pirellulales bacterium]